MLTLSHSGVLWLQDCSDKGSLKATRILAETFDRSGDYRIPDEWNLYFHERDRLEIALGYFESAYELGLESALVNTKRILITKETMLTTREQPAHSQGGYMTLCPIALMATCNKCPAVGICPLKEVLGDYKPENPAPAANDASVKDKTAN